MTAPTPCTHDEAALFHHGCPGPDESPVGVHALVIGVSKYLPPRRLRPRRFDDLRGTAPAASHFARFLVEDFHHPAGKPLRTVRLLMSPMPDQSDFLLTGGRPWTQAGYDEVNDALEDWAADCDSHIDNIALLYVAGHGVVTPDQAYWAFLSRAGSAADPYAYAMNLVATQQSMAFRRARTNVFVWDLCASAGAPATVGGGTGLAVTLPEKAPDDVPDEVHKGRVNPVVISLRIGTKAWSLNSKLGTVLSQALIGRDTAEYRERLMCTAGEILDDETYGVTPSGLERLLPHRVGDLLGDRRGEAEAVVTAWNGREGLNRPAPPPTFRIELHWLPPAAGATLDVEIRAADTDAVVAHHVLDGRPVTVPLPGGSYWLRTPESPYPRALKVFADRRVLATTGKDAA
jgi:hypothetical protein